MNNWRRKNIILEWLNLEAAATIQARNRQAEEHKSGE